RSLVPLRRAELAIGTAGFFARTASFLKSPRFPQASGPTPPSYNPVNRTQPEAYFFERIIIMGTEQVTLETQVFLGEDVVSRELDGEAVILNLESGTYFGLDPVGTRIWSLLQKNASLREAFETLQQEYEVAPNRLEGDLLRLVKELHTNGLLRLASLEEGHTIRA